VGFLSNFVLSYRVSEAEKHRKEKIEGEDLLSINNLTDILALHMIMYTNLYTIIIITIITCLNTRITYIILYHTILHSTTTSSTTEVRSRESSRAHFQSSTRNSLFFKRKNSK